MHLKNQDVYLLFDIHNGNIFYSSIYIYDTSLRFGSQFSFLFCNFTTFLKLFFQDPPPSSSKHTAHNKQACMAL